MGVGILSGQVRNSIAEVVDLVSHYPPSMGHHHVPATEWRGLEILSALCVLYEPVELYDPGGAVPWNCTTWQLIPGCASKKARGELDGLLDGWYLRLSPFSRGRTGQA